MPTPTIPAGNLFMNAIPYTGNSGTQSVTNGVAGQSFQPDFVWLKSRSNALNHNLFDSVRGVQNVLASNSTGGDNYAGTGELTAFNSNGFTLVNSGTYQTNQSGYTYVAWNFKAGGTAVSNTAGSITSSVSANTTSGFSIVTYTGTGANATVGHGLGVAPSMIIVKNRTNGVRNWVCYHSSLTSASYYLILNLTNAQSLDTGIWNATAPTSSVFSIGNAAENNESSGSMVAYCWAQVAGFSQFGSYTGNGSTDGPFVYTGFRPRFVMIKASSTGGAGYDWFIHDTARDTYNACTLDLEANLALSENQYGAEQDILSNGFKLRNAGGGTNQSGVTYIYACFAENPFKYANAR